LSRHTFVCRPLSVVERWTREIRQIDTTERQREGGRDRGREREREGETEIQCQRKRERRCRFFHGSHLFAGPYV